MTVLHALQKPKPKEKLKHLIACIACFFDTLFNKYKSKVV